ncbi:TPA: hypothetical protein QIT10_003887 [Enterobacter bugandensis]|nr:hypothetical protein [Enterobacter bugandensis]HEP0376448.1 hypothetical protein [Enterobacter bugandensis]
MINLTREDEQTICEYIRAAHSGYTGPVFIDINRLSQLHLSRSRLIVAECIYRQSGSWTFLGNADSEGEV